MNKRHKLFSLLIGAVIVASAFPSSGTGATSESIAFYNSKKSILEMKEYDEAYDTNHDGVVNVFDVIRENKEVFQEESYSDLKSQIHSLETQIEILTQKLAEKEDKTRAESDLSEINSVLSGKVDQQEGKQLSSNDYTNDEKQKLESLINYNDTSIKSEISELSSALSEKVDSQEGKQLSSNDYTDTDKEKLCSLNNYDDTMLRLEISESLSGKVDKNEGKQLSSNDYTNSDKEKLESLENYDDTQINERIDSLVQVAYEEKKEIELYIHNKVDKEEGKQLSSNDFTDEEKQKLDALNNYDDTEIMKAINNLKNDCVDISLFSKIGVIGDSFASGELYFNNGFYDKYEISWGQIMARRHGISCTNYSQGGLTTKTWLTNSHGLPLLLSNEPEDLYLLSLGINDTAHVELGSIEDITSHSSIEDFPDTFYGNYGKIIEKIINHAPHAKIVMIAMAYNGNDNYIAYNNAIVEIANLYGIPCIKQYEHDYFKTSTYLNMSGGHPTAIAYSGMAVAIEELLNECFINESGYFSDTFMY